MLPASEAALWVIWAPVGIWGDASADSVTEVQDFIIFVHENALWDKKKYI